MSENNSNKVFSLDFSNKQLSEFPKELFKFKASLVNLDISANPQLDLDKTIKALTEFTSLKQLKINIETGEEAKKLIDALPNLVILNDHPINEEEEENENIELIKQNTEINNTNSNLIEQEIAQINFNIINDKNINEKINNDKNNIINNNENIDKNIINNINSNNNSININNNINNSVEKETLKNEDNKFEYILNKIKEYSEITKEKYDLIMNEYNRLMNNNIKNTLDICSFFNKVLINLIKDAQEKNNIKISCIKPLLEAQTQNENIRLNFEEKIHSALQNSNNNNQSYIAIESLRGKNRLIQTESNSINQDKNSNLNVINLNNNSMNYINHSHLKKKYEKNGNNPSQKPLNKNEIRKQYSNNIKNVSLSKIKKINSNENDKIEKIDKNITFSIDNYLSNKNMKRNKSYNKPEINNINNTSHKEKEKKKYKFTHKSLGKKKISNKQSFLQENVDTYSNTYTNINTDYNNKLNVSNPTVILLNNTNSSPPLITDNQNYNKKKFDNKYIKKNYLINDNSKNNVRTISTISNDNNYLSKYDILKNCQDNPTINSLLLQIEKNSENFEISKIFDGLNEQVNYEYNNIHTINLKNLLDIINQVYKLRADRAKKQILGSFPKGTLEIYLMTYLKSKYGLKKLIIEWNLNILSSIKAYSKINGEVCLFGLILRNELDEGSIDILFKIKETVNSILKPLYRYNNDIINNIKNNKEFMKENEWVTIAQILYNNDNNLRQRFQNKIYGFIKKLVNNDKILEKSGRKILFGDFLNQLIMFNLKLRKKYLNNLIKLFKIQDKERYGIINHEEFKSMLENLGIIEREKFKEVTDILIENADKEGSGQITFNDVVVCFDNFYLDNQNENNTKEKIKLLDKINVLKLN